ncbi:hypothetical protein C7449_1178 [Mycoplana dimorpha]|uniref:Uncharacterized protein n=1 Tax=Mycoplana dimorpha TaxID=28320 RepID=A0A2T5AID0_MYCDI|nr:hypothetical protein C7449_1178 [Mycoplana dimorpha]
MSFRQECGGVWLHPRRHARHRNNTTGRHQATKKSPPGRRLKLVAERRWTCPRRGYRRGTCKVGSNRQRHVHHPNNAGHQWFPRHPTGSKKAPAEDRGSKADFREFRAAPAGRVAGRGLADPPARRRAQANRACPSGKELSAGRSNRCQWVMFQAEPLKPKCDCPDEQQQARPTHPVFLFPGINRFEDAFGLIPNSVPAIAELSRPSKVGHTPRSGARMVPCRDERASGQSILKHQTAIIKT